ncbi:MAG: MarC family protein [Bacteroidales bacterium]|jgi:MarC family membrane protein|nr:MarC family protein [Bacteroidales bacterium]
MSIHSIAYTFIASFVALFPVMNPIGNGFIVNGFLQDLDDDHRKIAIRKIITNCLVIGIGSLAIGHLVLLLFGLAVPVVQVGGGIVICKTGLEWLSDSTMTNTDKKQEAMDKINMFEIEKKLFYPISFPVSIGPGSISVIFTLMATSSVKGNLLESIINYAMIALVIILLCVILYAFLSQGNKITKRLGPTGSMVINKLVAFITFCIGIQIIVTGISKIFHLDIL